MIGMSALKRALLHHNVRTRFITYEDKIRLLAGNYSREILYGQDGNDLVDRLVSRGQPLMVSRLGGVELSCLNMYVKNRSNNQRKYPDKIKRAMSVNAGFFPADDDLLDRFCELCLDGIADVDVMGVMFNHKEDVICNSHCKDANLVELVALEPFFYKNPWSRYLAGKKVLVVHPFADSIKKQYGEKRQLLFKDPAVLPEFELSTVKAVQSIAGSKVEFETWFDAFDHMCDEIRNVDFDIAIIGAGAYGLPLASFVKRLGRQAIHLGGVTQILFGIKGRRWEIEYADCTAKLFNEHWIRPLASETPEGHGKVESGCYW